MAIFILATKECAKCYEAQLLTEFYVIRTGKDKGKLCFYCKYCERQRAKKRYLANLSIEKKAIYKNKPKIKINRYLDPRCKRRIYNNKMRRTYGITPEDYDRIFAEQKGLCAICQKPERAKGNGGSIKRLAIDHCHTTGKIRGLLCSKHNIGLGAFSDNVNFLSAAIAYLTK